MEQNPKGLLGKIIKENEIRAGEIAQQVKVFAEAWLPKFNTGNHIKVEGENQLHKTVL